ncbi:MAG: VOC family protein [Mucilaginibacter sp.]
MKPKMIWANVAVDDLQRTRNFYSRLGFKSNDPHQSADLTSFFFGDNNLVIHFFKRSVLEPNIKGQLTDTKTSNEIIFTLSAQSKDEVDNWAKEIESAGGRLVSQPEEFGKGYYGFVFADPDGHKFNVFYM